MMLFSDCCHRIEACRTGSFDLHGGGIERLWCMSVFAMMESVNFGWMENMNVLCLDMSVFVDELRDLQTNVDTENKERRAFLILSLLV